MITVGGSWLGNLFMVLHDYQFPEFGSGWNEDIADNLSGIQIETVPYPHRNSLFTVMD
jgi:hypothetical protein